MKNNESEWFKALLATGDCFSLLPLRFFILLASIVFLILFLYFSSCLVTISSSNLASASVSCLAFQYDPQRVVSLLSDVVFSASLLCLFFHFDYISRCECICCEWRRWISKQNCLYQIEIYREWCHWATRSSLRPEPDDPPRSSRLSRSWLAFPSLTSTWT